MNKTPKGGQKARALSSYRVIDISDSRAGAYCTKLMAGFGAEVIKIEPPGGDALRHRGPFFRDEEGQEHSIPALWYHTGKKSITLDWDTDCGRLELLELIHSADVVVESFRPGTLASWGMAYDTLRERHPGLVLTSVTDFGQTGPYRHYEGEEITCSALGGTMKLTGDPAREPLNSGSNACHSVAGMWAYNAALQALFQCAQTGQGQWIDVSIHECTVDNLEIHVANHLQLGKVPNRNNDTHFMAPWENYPCKDGHVTIVSSPVRHWFAAADMFEAPELKTDRFFTATDRMERREEVAKLMEPWLLQHTREEVFDSGRRHRQSFGMQTNLNEVFELPQHRDRKYFVEVEHPTLGRNRYAGRPFRCSDLEYITTVSPRVGEHNGSIAPRRPAFESTSQPATITTSDGPLAGIRVLDFSTHWASPHATRILADSGAEVITVEFTGLLCLFRGGRMTEQGCNNQPSWQALNRNKKSITLDLRRETERDIARELIATCDVVVENSRTGVLDRLGLGYEALKSIRSDILLLSLTGYGATGPWASHCAMGAAVEATSGIQSLTGYLDHPKRFRIKELDICAGIMGACAVITALLARKETGNGQHIDLSMMECATHAQIGEHLLFADLTGSPPPVYGNRDTDFSPQGTYPCQGEDAWVVITIRSPAEWHSLCNLIGNEDWRTAPELQSAEGRRAHHESIDEVIRNWTSNRDHYQAMAILQAEGIPAGAVLSLEELASDSHVRERGLFSTHERDVGERFMRPPVRMSGAELSVRRRGPDLGEHNLELVHEFLGRPLQDVPQIDEAQLFSAYFPLPGDRPVDAHRPDYSP